MSAITFELPITGIPDIPLRDGTPFRGFFKGGKMHVTVEAEETQTKPAPPMTERGQAARRFIEKWQGAFTMPTQEELDADPRLDYLIKKHVLCVPSDQLFTDEID